MRSRISVVRAKGCNANELDGLLLNPFACLCFRPAATALGISVILDVAGSRRVNTSAAEQPATAIVKQI